jgi:hypothetical protein
MASEVLRSVTVAEILTLSQQTAILVRRLTDMKGHQTRGTILPPYTGRGLEQSKVIRCRKVSGIGR